MQRDLTEKQFAAAIARAGFEAVGVLGYYRVTESVSVCALNAGKRRRDQLAYLHREAAKARAAEERRAVARRHRDADAACGREWVCACGPCSTERRYREMIATKRKAAR